MVKFNIKKYGGWGHRDRSSRSDGELFLNLYFNWQVINL